MNGRALGDRAIEVSPSSARVLERAAEILTPFPVDTVFINSLTASRVKIDLALETGRVLLAGSAIFNVVQHAFDVPIHLHLLKLFNKIRLSCTHINLLCHRRRCLPICLIQQRSLVRLCVLQRCPEVSHSGQEIGSVVLKAVDTTTLRRMSVVYAAEQVVRKPP